MKTKHSIIAAFCVLVLTITASADPIPVNVNNLARAETDMYLSRFVLRGGFGKFDHNRTPSPIDKQDVVRMNRDTLYSAAVFDLDASSVTLALPDAGKRFMSLLLINEDHYVIDTVCAPSSVTITRERAGTRYFVALVRTFVNANDPADVKIANAAQDAIKIEQAKTGTFEVPQWDPVTQKKARETLQALFALEGIKEPRFGRKDEVDPISWLLSTAAGWGGNPRRDAIYIPFFPKNSDGKAAYTVKVKDVPVDGFWSITMYDAKGFTRIDPTTVIASPYRSWSFDSTITRMPEFIAPGLGKKNNTVTINLEVGENASGVLYALGGASGGLTCYMDQGHLCFEYNMMIIDRYLAKSAEKITPGKHTIVVDTTLKASRPGAPADIALSVDGKEVARTLAKITVPGAFTASETFDVGTDLGSPVSKLYYDRRPFAFTGKIKKIAVDLK